MGLRAGSTLYIVGSYIYFEYYLNYDTINFIQEMTIFENLILAFELFAKLF